MSAMSNALFRFGKIVTSDIKAAVRIMAQKNDFDERLLMYFPEHEYFYAYDKRNECKEGDYVTIRELTEKEDKRITHVVEKLVYKEGFFIDPLNGKQCSNYEYISDINQIRELFNSNLMKKDEHQSS